MTPPRGGLDRSVQPKAGPTPATRVPTWTRTTLPNGAQLVVVEKHDLPLVSFNVNFVGGSNNFEPADKLVNQKTEGARVITVGRAR